MQFFPEINEMPLTKGTSEDSIHHPNDLVLSEKVVDRLRTAKHKDPPKIDEKRIVRNLTNHARELDNYTRRLNKVMENSIYRSLNSVESQLNVKESAVCKQEQDNLKSCYQNHSNNSLNCSKDVQEYFNCIKRKQQRTNDKS